MTVASTTNRKTYTGDNVTTSFATSPVIFYVTSDLQVRVTVIATGVSTLLTENTHYTVSGGSSSGATGTVSLAGGSSPHGALLSTEKLVILRVLPFTQAVDFVNNSSSDAEVIETAFDKLTDIDQQLSERQDRALTFPEGDVSGSTNTLQDASARASRLLGFDALGLLTTIAVTVGTSLVDLASSVGSTLIGFLQAGVGAVLRTLQAKLRDTVSLKDFGVTGSGDETTKIQAAIDACKVNGQKLRVPYGVYSYTALNLDGIVQGLHIVGESDPSGATDFSKCSTLRCTSAGAGIGISIKSSYGVTLEKLALTYNSASYTGDLVRTGQSVLATDSAFITLDSCVLTGEGAAVGANSLFFTDKSIVERVHKCTFKNAVAGIRSGTSYTNVLTVEDCTFQALTSFNVKFDGTSTCQSIYFKGNTFEALVNGKASAFDMGTAAYIEGLTFIGNWFGDVTVNGGVYWIHAKALGMSVEGNYFATAGAGAGDYAIQLDGCQGVAINGGNRFDSKAVNIATACLGVVINGNDLVVGSTAIVVAAGAIPMVFGNNAYSDTFGGVVRVAGVASPKVIFSPVSGATKVGNIAQNGDVLYVGGEDGVANAASFAIATGQFYPSTELRAAQTAAGIFAGTGVPNNANGNNGDFYFRGDGTQAGNTLFYHKQAGAWVAAITT